MEDEDVLMLYGDEGRPDEAASFGAHFFRAMGLSKQARARGATSAARGHKGPPAQNKETLMQG